MKKTINYEKDILFKTDIEEICSISLEHDFTVDDGFLKGDFIVSGDYKTSALSINKEKFEYRLPLEYELESTVDVNTLSYDVENFEYNINGDELSVYIDFGIRYEEIQKEPIIPITESEINFDDLIISSIDQKDDEIRDEEKMEKKDEEERNIETNSMVQSIAKDDSYVKYHVHIVRDGESLESIASKYSVSIDLIKEYNDIEGIELKSKLIIPEYYE